MATRVMNKGVCLYGMGFGDETYTGDQKLLKRKKVVFKDEEEEKGPVRNCCSKKRISVCCSDDESPSSIGKNSDLSESSSMGKSAGCDDGEEVQSSYKVGALDAMETLQEVLPIRRGISGFYNGKSKSFTSLADATSLTSIKDMGKPDNAYIRKRRNLLACNLTWDKNRRGNGKRFSGSMSGLALALLMTNKQATTGECTAAASPSAAGRSFSLADLHQCCIGGTGSNHQEVILMDRKV